MHAAGRYRPFFSSLDASIEDGGDFVAYHTVEHAAGLLGIDKGRVDVAGIIECFKTASLVIELKATRLILVFGGRISLICQAMASPSRSGSGER